MPSRESSVIRHSSHISFSNPSVVLTSSCHCFCLRSHATSQGQKAKELLFSVSLLRFVLSLIVRAAKFPNLSDPAFSVLWWIHHMSYVKKKSQHTSRTCRLPDIKYRPYPFVAMNVSYRLSGCIARPKFPPMPFILCPSPPSWYR